MKLSISNIGWDEQNKSEIYEFLQEKQFDAIEIAPTILIKENPYDNIEIAKEITDKLSKKYNLKISSMQSIWFGKTENIFDEKGAEELANYTKKAIDFAVAIKCNNLVFGCPKNRIMPEDKSVEDSISFFREIGEYANLKNTIVALEANPTIYGTNFINRTEEAFELAKKINSERNKSKCGFWNNNTKRRRFTNHF